MTKTHPNEQTGPLDAYVERYCSPQLHGTRGAVTRGRGPPFAGRRRRARRYMAALCQERVVYGE